MVVKQFRPFVKVVNLMHFSRVLALNEGIRVYGYNCGVNGLND